MPREFNNRTASVISFVLYRDKSQTKTMKYDLGFMLVAYQHLYMQLYDNSAELTYPEKPALPEPIYQPIGDAPALPEKTRVRYSQ